MNFSTEGYRDTSPDKNNPMNIIQSNIISMKGVSKPITAIPIIGGKPDYSKKRVLQPEQEDAYFEGAEAVLEIPFAQSDWGQIGFGQGTGLNYMGDINMNGVLPNFNVNTSYIPQTTQPTPPSQNQGTVEALNITPQGLNLLPTNIAPSQESINTAREQAQQEAERLGINWESPQNNNQVFDYWSTILSNAGGTRDLSSSLVRAGYGLNWNANNYDWASPQAKKQAQAGNTLATVGAIGNSLLKGAKDFMYGAAAANREQEAFNEYHDNMDWVMRNRNKYHFQKGGQIQDEMILTGNYTTGLPENAPVQISAEVEAEEYLQTPDGKVTEVLGRRHSHKDGGEYIAAEPGTKVISDYLKIGGELSKKLKKDFELNTNASNSFATVLDKYKKKIGLTELLEDYQNTIGKIKDQEEVDNLPTKELNLSFLSKKVQELEAEKAPLDKQMEAFTSFIFEEQEKHKVDEAEKKTYKKGGLKLYQEGGQIAPEQIEQILQQYSQFSGIQYEQLIQEFSQLTPQEQEQALAEMVQEMQGGQQQQQQNPEIAQLIQGYAQATGQDPNQLIQQLQQLPQEQQQQTLQQMMDSLSSSQQQPTMQKGGSVPKYQVGVQTPVYPYNYEGKAVNLGNRVNIALNPSDYGNFVYTNPLAQIEYQAQHFNPQTGVFDTVDENETLNWYNTYNPFLIDGLINQSEEEGLFLKADKGTTKKLQEKYDRQVEDNVLLFSDIYGYNKEDLRKYAEDIKFNPDAKFGESSRRYDDKYGWFTSTRSVFQRPIVTPEQLKQLNDAGIITGRQALQTNPDKAKEILGEETYAKVVEGLDKYKDADYVIGSLTPEPTEEQPPTETTATDTDKTKPYDKGKQRNVPILPVAEIDQSLPFPTGLDFGRMQSVSPINIQPVNISPEQQINEVNRQVALGNSMVNFAPDAARAAQIANLVATGTQATNQAITARNLQNAQMNQQVEQYNENQVGAADKMNIELAENYTQRYLQALSALEGQQAGWYNYMNQLAGMQSRNRWNANLAASLFPNFRITGDGRIINIGGEVGIGYQLPENNNTQTRTTTKRKNSDGSTTSTTETSKQQGGTIKEYLSNLMFKS